MDVQEAYAQIQMLARLCYAVSIEDAQAVVKEIEYTDSFMPLFDPTGWMKISKNIPGHARLAQAFLAFRRELEDLIGGEVPRE